MHATKLQAAWPVAVAIFVRMLVWVILPHTRFASDEDSYYRVATLLLTTGQQDVFWPPVTGWLIALVATVLQTTDPQWIRLAWIAVDLGCVVGVYALATRVAERLPVGVNASGFVSAATLGYGLYLPAISFAQFTTSETPALLLVLWSLWVLMTPTLAVRHAVFSGVLLGVLAITRPSLLPLVVVLPAARLFFEERAWAIRFAAVSVLASATIVAVVVVRNWSIAGEPTIAQNSAYNLYIGNRPLYAEDLDLFHPIATAGQIEFRRQYFSGELTYPTQSPDELQREAFRWIRENPGQFLRRAVGRLARVFAPKTDVLELIGGERQAGVFNPRAMAVLGVANIQWLTVSLDSLACIGCIVRLAPYSWRWCSVVCRCV
jgi:hypothetical protein